MEIDLTLEAVENARSCQGPIALITEYSAVPL